MFLSQEIINLFPKELSTELQETASAFNGTIEEIRVKLNQPITLRNLYAEQTVSSVRVSAEHIMHIVLTASNGSLHTVTEYLKQGFLPLENGCRMGICGEGVYQKGEFSGIRNISSLCIRLAKEVKGCADDIFADIAVPQFDNTIIIAPPGVGKTTLLRELIRKLSNTGYYVAVADERGEVSGISKGILHFDLGPRCDVSFGIDKCSAGEKLIRTMSPNILAMDEITAARDVPAITEAVHCGVKLLTTIHGKDLSILYSPKFSPIQNLNIFRYAIIISLANNSRKYHLEILHD